MFMQGGAGRLYVFGEKFGTKFWSRSRANHDLHEQLDNCLEFILSTYS